MVKIGVIGCGKIAQTRHLPEYATNPHAKLVGYYDKIRGADGGAVRRQGVRDLL